MWSWKIRHEHNKRWHEEVQIILRHIIHWAGLWLTSETCGINDPDDEDSPSETQECDGVKVPKTWNTLGDKLYKALVYYNQTETNNVCMHNTFRFLFFPTDVSLSCILAIKYIHRGLISGTTRILFYYQVVMVTKHKLICPLINRFYECFIVFMCSIHGQVRKKKKIKITGFYVPVHILGFLWEVERIRLTKKKPRYKERTLQYTQTINTRAIFTNILSLNLRLGLKIVNLKFHWSGRFSGKLYKGTCETCLLEHKHQFSTHILTHLTSYSAI